MAQIASNYTHFFYQIQPSSSNEPDAADDVGPSSFTPTAHDASLMEWLIALWPARSAGYWAAKTLRSRDCSAEKICGWSSWCIGGEYWHQNEEDNSALWWPIHVVGNYVVKTNKTLTQLQTDFIWGEWPHSTDRDGCQSSDAEILSWGCKRDHLSSSICNSWQKGGEYG